MARKPRKQDAETPSSAAERTGFVFGEPTTFDTIPAKETTLPGYRQIENLEANTMIRVDGASIDDMKTLTRKVVKNNKGRKYDFRSIDPENPGAGTNVYRIA